MEYPDVSLEVGGSPLDLAFPTQTVTYLGGAETTRRAVRLGGIDLVEA